MYILIRIDTEIIEKCTKGLFGNLETHKKRLKGYENITDIHIKYKEEDIERLSLHLDILFKRCFIYVGSVQMMINDIRLRLTRYNNDNAEEIMRKMLK